MARSLLCGLIVCGVVVVGGVGGCGRTEGPVADAAAFPATLVVAKVEGEPVRVKEAKSSVKAGERIVVHGHIGGRKDPFTRGRASFMLIDTPLHPCVDDCRTPWDFCCDTQADIAANAVTVQVVGADGQVIRSGINGLKGIKPGAEVIVAGTVGTAEGSTLTLNAEQIWVKGG